jgi:rod shape-determining protein MreD
MVKKIIWVLVFALSAFLLESTILRRFTLFGAIPDLALGILVYTAYINGTMIGQLSGFFSGLILDLISAAPLGFNLLIRTMTGALAGLLKGMFFLDAVFFPMLLCFCATLFKGLSVYLLHLIFSGAVPAFSLFSPVFWVELGLNTASAPFLFGFLGLFKPLFAGKEEN